MSVLFSPLKIRNVTFKNRIVVSPMCQYSSADGFAGDWHLVHLGSRAVGGAGLVIAEATAVSPEGRISPGDLGIWKDEHIQGLQRIAAFIGGQGAVAGIQIAHAGRKSSQEPPWKGDRPIAPVEGGWQTVAPSAIPYKDGGPVPRELSQEEIADLVVKFREAAIRAHRAGFRLLEIHAAHGYLIHEFLSPLSNTRSDVYGGSFTNRIRFLEEIVNEVRRVWPAEYPLFVRISATDYAKGGWTPAESVRLAGRLKELGVDLVDCSSGGNVHGVRFEVKPLYQTHFAEQVKKEAGILTGAVGLITTATEAESIISEGRADLVFMAREFLRDPYFPLHAADELDGSAAWPVQYERAKKKG